MPRWIPLLLSLLTVNTFAKAPSVGDYPSIQAALDAHPNTLVFVPAGDHFIDEKIRLRGVRCGMFGPGRIIQHNPAHPIIEIEDAVDASIRDVTLTRSKGNQETRAETLVAIRCQGLVVDNVRFQDNHSRSPNISLRECRHARVSRCTIRNYMRVTVDDRTDSPHWGYAFNCTDGTGIAVNRSVGTLIEGNTIVEERLVPTRELKKRHRLGDWIKRSPVKGTLLSQSAWDRGYTDAWQQGSAIIVTGPEHSELTRILGNHIENAAQGIDLHCDRVIVANNVVANSFVGMKAMHGSRHVMIRGNQFHRNSLWAIGLMPGAAAHAGNPDGASIIAHNLITAFGHGNAHWIWGKERSPFKFDTGQEPDDPPLTDVLIHGNIVSADGPPRYRHAVLISAPGTPKAPRNLRFRNNLFTPGTEGIANVPLDASGSP